MRQKPNLTSEALCNRLRRRARDESENKLFPHSHHLFAVAADRIEKLEDTIATLLLDGALGGLCADCQLPLKLEDTCVASNMNTGVTRTICQTCAQLSTEGSVRSEQGDEW